MSSRILEQDLVTKNAMKLFKVWYKQAEKSCPDSYMYFCLSTVDHNQKPSSRYVCATSFDEKCFRFSTNDNSPKMEDIRRNAYVSMNFFWPPMQKSIRINGLVTRYLNGEADYAMCPGFQNQITLTAVEYQSRPIKNAETLDDMREKVLKSNSYKKCPSFWITLEIEPIYIEFFNMQPHFDGDRLRFFNPRFNSRKDFDENLVQTGDDGWFFYRLAP